MVGSDIEIKIKGIELRIAQRFSDSRGSVDRYFAKEELDPDFNAGKLLISHNKAGAVRAINFQQTNPKAKRITCVEGRLFVAVVDLRKGSGTFGKWQSFELTPENHCVLCVPPGTGVGCYSLTDSISLNLSEESSGVTSDTSIFWKDPDLAIEWPPESETNVILSQRGKSFMSFAEYKNKYSGIEI
jgi:dTDP-4-dehydrorhamnose 3,5-epimerase